MNSSVRVWKPGSQISKLFPVLPLAGAIEEVTEDDRIEKMLGLDLGSPVILPAFIPAPLGPSR